jgi:hypothetical protein
LYRILSNGTKCKEASPENSSDISNYYEPKNDENNDDYGTYTEPK